MSIKEFQILGRLGEGAYSSVFKVKRLSDKAEYALKKVKMGKLSEKEKENAVNEVRILASLDHPNVIGYRQVFFEDATSSLCLVMDYADGGDVLQKINQHQRTGTTFPEKEIWSIFIQIVKGLAALHKRKILHRDMKCANIFLCKNGLVKLGDLNVSKVAKKGLLYTQTGTPYYASPEVWKDKPYDQRSDIWSLGCVLYQLITLKPPFRANDMQGLYRKVVRGQYNKIPSTYSQDLSALLAQLLQVNAKMRPTCKQILDLYSVQKRMSLLPAARKNLNTLSTNLIDSQRAEPSDLLGTIKVPRNLHNLGERLPKPNYNRNLSVPSKFPLLISPDSDKINEMRSDIASIAPSVRQALHEKVTAALDEVNQSGRHETHEQALIDQQNKLVERYIHYQNRRGSGPQYAKPMPPPALPEKEVQIKRDSRESIKSHSADNQENRVYRHADPRLPPSRKLLLPPKRPDLLYPHPPIETPKPKDQFDLPRPMRRQLNQLYSRGYGAPTPASNPSRYEHAHPVLRQNPSELKLPHIRGNARNLIAGSLSEKPLLRGGVAISSSKRALLEEINPRPNAVSVLPNSRGSNGSRISPMVPAAHLYRQESRPQHISLDQGYPSPVDRRNENSNYYDYSKGLGDAAGRLQVSNHVLLQARRFNHEKLYTPSGLVLNSKRQFQNMDKNMPSGAKYLSEKSKIATPVWWG